MRLELDSLSYAYNARAPLFQALNLRLDIPQFISVIGPNGAGKSTLLKIWANLLKPKTGSVLLNTKEINSMPLNERAKAIAYLPQSSSTTFTSTVEEVVLLGRRPYLDMFSTYSRADYEKVYESLELVGLSDFSKRKIDTLSGGELQRCMIARMLCTDAEVLILDEPISAIDINQTLLILNLFKRLVEQGKTVVTSLHQIELAYRFSDLTICLGKTITNNHLIGPAKKIITVKNLKSVFNIQARFHENHLLVEKAL